MGAPATVRLGEISNFIWELFQIESINISQLLSLGVMTAKSALIRPFPASRLQFQVAKIAMIKMINLSNIPEAILRIAPAASSRANFNSFGARSYNWPHRAPAMHIHQLFVAHRQQLCRSQSPQRLSGTVALCGGSHGRRREAAAESPRTCHRWPPP